MTLETYHIAETQDILSPENIADKIIARRKAIQTKLAKLSALLCAVSQEYQTAIAEVHESNQEFAANGLNTSEYVHYFQGPENMDEELFGIINGFINGDDSEVVLESDLNNQ